MCRTHKLITLRIHFYLLHVNFDLSAILMISYRRMFLLFTRIFDPVNSLENILPTCKPVFVKPDVPVNDTFGLNIQFLHNIGVKLPLKNRVFVQNVSI